MRVLQLVEIDARPWPRQRAATDRPRAWRSRAAARRSGVRAPSAPSTSVSGAWICSFTSPRPCALQRMARMAARFCLHARHGERADRLDARLFGRLEDRAGVAARGAAVRGRCCPRDRRASARSASPAPRTAATSSAGSEREGRGRRAFLPRSIGCFGRERDLELRLARDRAHRAGHRALERIRGIFVLHVRAFTDPRLTPPSPWRRIRAAPRRSSADRIPRPSAAPARRICSGT